MSLKEEQTRITERVWNSILKFGAWEMMWAIGWGFRWRRVADPLWVWSVWHLGPFVFIHWHE